MTRQTQEFTTPLGNKVVLNSYLTGREVAEIKSIMLAAVKLTTGDLESKKFDMSGLSGDVIVAQERKTLECLVVSLNGDIEKPVEKLLDLPSSESEAVFKEIEKIKNPTNPAN